LILSLHHQTTQFDSTPATTENSGNNKMKTLSAYTITWAVIDACKGKNSKRDLNIMFRCGLATISGSHFLGKPFMCHFPTKESAIEKLSKVTGLNKKYNVLLITDKQFGMSSFNSDITAVATNKQLSESFTIN
jgi:hypothetical protein